MLTENVNRGDLVDSRANGVMPARGTSWKHPLRLQILWHRAVRLGARDNITIFSFRVCPLQLKIFGAKIKMD